MSKSSLAFWADSGGSSISQSFDGDKGVDRKGRPEIERRIRALDRRNGKISEIRDRIVEDRAVIEHEKGRNDTEYAVIVEQVESASADLVRLKKRANAADEEISRGMAELEKVVTDLEVRKDKLARLRSEANVLRDLERVTTSELQTVEHDIGMNERETTVIVDIEEENNENEIRLKKLLKVLKEKQEIVSAKRAAVAKIMASTRIASDEFEREMTNGEMSMICRSSCSYSGS